MATKKAVTRAVYGVNDIMAMLDCSQSYAYKIIKKLRDMQAAEGYFVVSKSGTVDQDYFHAKVYRTKGA